MSAITTTSGPSTRRAGRLVVAFVLALVALVGVQSQPAGAIVPFVDPWMYGPPTAPTLVTAPRLSVTAVAVGNTVTATPPVFSNATRIDYAWEFCTRRPGAALSCKETGVWGTRYTPTLASTGGMTLTQWSSASYFVRVRAVAYNSVGASAPTWSGVAQVVPGAARGQFDLIQWWDGSTFAVYGGAAADGVDGAIHFRIRAVRADGVTVAQTFGTTNMFRPELRSIWPNTGNWGGFNVAVHGASTATRVCLDVGTSYVPVLCRNLPYR